MAEKSPLEEANDRYKQAAKVAKEAAATYPALVPLPGEKLVAAAAELLFATGDLAVTALEKLAEIEANRRAAAIANERSVRRLTWGIFLATAAYTATAIWHEVRTPVTPPPLGTVTPGAVNVSPTINPAPHASPREREPKP